MVRSWLDDLETILFPRNFDRIRHSSHHNIKDRTKMFSPETWKNKTIMVNI